MCSNDNMIVCVCVSMFVCELKTSWIFSNSSYVCYHISYT